MTLTSINTWIWNFNTRFVQLMDGMDNTTPLLNFPTGNIVGIGELDINNVGISSWCYFSTYMVPNAFNGILIDGLKTRLKIRFKYASKRWFY